MASNNKNNIRDQKKERSRLFQNEMTLQPSEVLFLIWRLNAIMDFNALQPRLEYFQSGTLSTRDPLPFQYQG